METITVLKLIAGVQAAGGVAALIDETRSITIEELRAAGCKVAELLVSQPDNHDQAVEIGETLRRSGAVELIVAATYTHRIRVHGHGAITFAIMGEITTSEVPGTLARDEIGNAIDDAFEWDVRGGELWTRGGDSRPWSSAGKLPAGLDSIASVVGFLQE